MLLGINALVYAILSRITQCNTLQHVQTKYDKQKVERRNRHNDNFDKKDNNVLISNPFTALITHMDYVL